MHSLQFDVSHCSRCLFIADTNLAGGTKLNFSFYRCSLIDLKCVWDSSLLKSCTSVISYLLLDHYALLSFLQSNI